MQTKPANWAALFNASHKTEYKFVINGVDYTGSNISGTPTISKPLLDKPALGRVCTGSLSLTVLTEGMAAIPKAAQVDAYCRLRAASGGTVTDWLQQGSYYITSRSGGSTLKLTCLDGMIKAGTTYRDKSAFIEWPQTMTAVVNEIASIMGVSIDPRTVIMTGADYKVSYPNDDMLISEVLGMIAAAHGGNWIMTETGKLRLITFSGASDTAQQILGKTHTGYESRGKTKIISRVILTDNAGNDFIAGDDTGATLGVKCNYATQNIVNALCNGSGSILYGVMYEPYSINSAYLDPCLELGDTISITDYGDTVHLVILQAAKINCTVAYTTLLSANTDEETEDEYPYITTKDLSIERAIKTDQTYFGNRLTRSDGFVSELLVNGIAKARLTANAALFAMQTRDGELWVDRIYFDTATEKYVITGDVKIYGAVTVNDLATSGSVEINNGNIKGGTLTLGGSGNVNGQLRVNDASGNQVVRLDNTGISATKGNILLEADGETSNGLRVGYYPNGSGNSTNAKTSTVTPSYVLVNDNATSTGMSLWPSSLRGGITYSIISWTPTETIFGTVYNNVVGIECSKIRAYGDSTFQSSFNYLNISNQLSVFGPVIISSSGSLMCYGTKSRAVNTRHYGERLLYSLETPTPMFEDIGDGKTDETGVAYIYFDPVFAECIDSSSYQAFLQKCGQGDLWVDARESEYFVVRGTPNLRFSWRVAAKQVDYAEKRLDDVETPVEEGEFDNMADQILKEDENI